LRTIKKLVRGADGWSLREGLEQERIAFADVLRDEESARVLESFAGSPDPVAR
jgi:hypothetical protein